MPRRCSWHLGRGEPLWQEIAKGAGSRFTLGLSDADQQFSRSFGEFEQNLQAGAARGPAILGDKRKFPNPNSAIGNHPRHGRTLGTDRESVRDVLDIAADMDAPLLVKNGGADGITAVWRIGLGAYGDRGSHEFGHQGIMGLLHHRDGDPVPALARLTIPIARDMAILAQHLARKLAENPLSLPMDDPHLVNPS